MRRGLVNGQGGGWKGGGGAEGCGCDNESKPHTSTNDYYASIAWHLFSSYLPSLTTYSGCVVCVNDLMNLYAVEHKSKWQQKKAVKSWLTRLGIPYFVSEADGKISDLSPERPTKMLMKQITDSGDNNTGSIEENDVYVWRASDTSTKSEQLIFLTPEDLQRFTLMSNQCVADRMVKMCNNAVTFDLQDIMRLSCELSGICDDCDP